jgi:hypothetical protein
MLGEIATPTADTKANASALDLDQKTISPWERYYGQAVSSEEARSIEENIVGFFSVLADWDAADLEKKPN